MTASGRSRPAPPLRTRHALVVYRPTDARAFNGTVIVEWMNVSGTTDANPDWTLTHNELVREGYVWVGVSAQAVGLNATKGVDPVRYAALSHPGDSFSYDIFSQAGHAIRANSALMLGGLTPKKVIAVGESQSAGSSRHVHQRCAPARQRVRRVPRAQPQRRGIGTVPGATRGDQPRRTRRSSATTSTTRCSSSRPRPTSTLPLASPIPTKFRMWEAAGSVALRPLRPRDRPE